MNDKKIAKELMIVARLLSSDAQEKMNKGMVKNLYQGIFENARKYGIVDPDGSVQCHGSLGLVRDLFSDYWWFKKIKFYDWNESRWKKVAQRLIDDGAVDKFSNKAVKELIEDISDMSVNGHSFMEYEGKYVDPYLKSKGVNDSQIQKFDKYFKGIM